ncbi:DUF3344 domain-containing protein [Streptomyces sp. NPDC017941]|uniref:DUF3344 domain-containing protein n=1 Tax=Streptomyces sp. NPDC017941 TaxID=3365018 RepID=UPI003793CD57
MRHLLGLRRRVRRTVVVLLALTGCLTLDGTVAGAPAVPATSGEEVRIAFAQRYHAVQHGGLVRAANSVVTCRRPVPRTQSAAAGAAACADVRRGGPGANHGFDMSHTDIDDDPNTYNSSAGEVRLPAGSRVSYARLYWGGNLRAGERKPPEHSGRVLIAEPGGRYRALFADTLVGHQAAHGADAFQASADVTSLVRDSGAGLYTVAQVNTAKGHSRTGAWGGWTLVVAYENADEPLRSLSLWDGFDSFGAPGREHAEVRMGAGRGVGGVGGVVGADGAKGAGGVVGADGAKGVSGVDGVGGADRPSGAGGVVGADGPSMTGGAVEADGPSMAGGVVGVVAYDGDRGVRGDALRVSAGRGSGPAPLSDPTNPSDDVLNSTVSEPGPPARRSPAYANTLGYDSDVLPLGDRLRGQRGELTLRVSSRADAAWIGVLFAAVDVPGGTVPRPADRPR